MDQALHAGGDARGDHALRAGNVRIGHLGGDLALDRDGGSAVEDRFGTGERARQCLGRCEIGFTPFDREIVEMGDLGTGASSRDDLVTGAQELGGEVATEQAAGTGDRDAVMTGA